VALDFCSWLLLWFAGATTENLPAGVLYRVKSTYKYNREDVDELSFEIGEIIRVVEYEDPEEQVCICLRLFVLPSNNPS
jgi:hypothetical protein